MARYRQKSPEDLSWNKIRRHATRALDTIIADKREEVLNVVLSTAFEQFVVAMQKGEIKEIEARYEAFALEIVGDIVPEEFGVAPADD